MLKKNAPSNHFPCFVAITSEEFSTLPLEAQVKALTREVIDLKRRVREVELAYMEVKEDESSSDENEIIDLSYSPPRKINKFN